MKLKTFFADSIPSAMSDIRQVFGEKAVIVSSFRTNDKGVRLIVATEEQDVFFNSPIQDEMRKSKQRRTFFKNMLSHRHLSDEYIERLVNAVARKSIKTSEDKLLSRALSEMYAYKSIEPLKKNGLYVFMGTAGCGKTTVVSKLAFHTKALKIKTALVTLDTRKSKQSSELLRYAHLMQIPCTTLHEWDKLNETVTMLRLNHDLILIDTPSLNPYHTEDIARMHMIKTQLSDAELVYVQPAGLDYHEARAQGCVFAHQGCTEMVITKTDMSTAYNGFLQSALFSAFRLAGLSESPYITDYLKEITPDKLASLLKNGVSEGEDE